MPDIKTTISDSPATELIACAVCLAEIPRSVAQSQEGADYVYHFCGPACYGKWREAEAISEIGIAVTGRELDFDAARRLAAMVAGEGGSEPILLAWFDRHRGQASPDVPECQQQPGWLVYAQSRGSNLRVSINGGEYEFAFISE